MSKVKVELRIAAVEEFEYLTSRGYIRSDIYNLWRAREGEPGESIMSFPEPVKDEMDDILKDLPWEDPAKRLVPPS